MRNSGPEYAKGAQEGTMHVHELLHINGEVTCGKPKVLLGC
jgi:hypothetical protein